MRYASAVESLMLLVFIGASPVKEAWQAPTTPEPFETVSLCQLTKDWKKYDHRSVKIEAIYATGAESYTVYDPDCTSRDQTAWVEFPADVQKKTPQKTMDKLNRLLRSDSRVRLVVVGEFAGPKKVDIPPNTPPQVADLMRSVGSRYGHQNQWNFQFVFSKIEKVEPVPASEPWLK
jgi:hypothetical protein